jgi:hypothetical protein
MQELANKSFQEITNLTVAKIWGSNREVLGITLSDGQNCKAGFHNNDEFHAFDPAKKITSIKTIIFKHELDIAQINFFHNEERLFAWGSDDDVHIQRAGGRIEVFEIAIDEQLIGCQIHKVKPYYWYDEKPAGVTWIKIKTLKI